MSSLSETDMATDTLVERGQRVYEEQLRATLEPSHSGCYVAIEPTTGRYFLGDTGTAALVAARAAMPEARFYLMRVGQQAAHTVGGHATRAR